jgi:hypothetical protein
MGDACNNQASRTVLQVQDTGVPSKPLCGQPFDLDGFTGLELHCADGTDIGASQVTAVFQGDKQTHNCTKLPLTVYPTACDPSHISSIWQLFACQ